MQLVLFVLHPIHFDPKLNLLQGFLKLVDVRTHVVVFESFEIRVDGILLVFFSSGRTQQERTLYVSFLFEMPTHLDAGVRFTTPSHTLEHEECW